MKTKNLSLLFFTLLTLFIARLGHAQTTIISDNYNITTIGTGFALDNGVNTGINPPGTNRMTGTAAANLHYFQTIATRAPSFYDINSNRIRVSTDTSIGRFTLSANGSTPFDFSQAVGAAYASPGDPAIYEIRISMRNNATSTARFAFALGTVEGDAGTWDFGVQLYRATATDFYSIQRRIDTGSSGVPDINTVMATTGPATAGSSTNINFLIRVTDAGAQTNAYNSIVQVSTNNGVDWIYDSSTNTTDLPNGWRLDGPGRYIMFDQASNGSGAVFYDNFSIVSVYSPLPPPERVWSGLGTDNNWSTGDNWAGIAPVNGDPLIFNGTVRQTNINDITDLIVPSVAFNNGGFSLSGNLLSIDGGITSTAGTNTFNGDLAWSSTALKNWNIASGGEVILNNISSLEVNGDNNVFGGGTLRVKGTLNIGQATTANPAFVINEGKHIVDGGTFASRGGYRIGSQASGIGAQTVLTNGANFTLTTSGANLRVGDSANPVASRLLIDNSTLTMTGASIGVSYAAGAIGVVNQTGGTVSGGIINFSQAGVGDGTYTLKNGTLQPTQIKKNTAGGIGRIYFDNAILRPAAGANSAFFTGLDVAEIQAGGLTVDATSDVIIGQSLSGSGILTKSSFGTLTLTGPNTYTGNTVVQSGRLVMSTQQTNATTVSVADGAEFGVVARNLDSSLSVSALNFSGPSFNVLHIDLATFGTPTAPMMKVNSLSVGGPVTINVANGSELSTGQFVLVDYNGAISGGFQFTLGSLPPGVTATLSNNVANSSIDLNITGVPGYRWTGAAGSDWDYSSQNWINNQTGSASTYADGFLTEFKDGAATGNVNVNIFPFPSLIRISNNVLPYVMSGGALTLPTIKKFGTNSFTRSGGEADFVDFIEVNAGSFIYEHFSDANFTPKLTDVGVGSGTFVKQGTGKLTFTSTNTTYDGGIRVQQGILKLGGTDALGSTNGGTTIASGATLDLNDQIFPHEAVVVSGSGVSGQGAIIDSATGGAVANNLTDVTMVGDTTFGSSGRWDLRVRNSTGPDLGLRGNGFNLTKVGSGSVSIACQRNIGALTPYWEMNLGDVFIREGSITFAESLSLGNPAKSIFVSDGASLGTFDLAATNPIVRTVYLTNATITAGGSTGDINPFNGPILVTGAAHLRPTDAQLIVNGNIGGTGAVNISASGTGKVLLNGVNNYPGDTTVTNGFFGGTGTLAGNLIVLGGTNAPGVSVGTFTVNGSVTLGGMTEMELNRSLSPNSDRIVAGGAMNFGGALKVILATGAPSPQAGDVYQLFNKGSGSAFSQVSLPNLSALPGGLAWDTSNLNVNGSITVTGAATPPTISSVSNNNGNFVFSGTGGIQGNTYYVLSSTNVALPVANWTPVATNVFGAGGSFSFTNAINPANIATFYLLQIP